MSDTTTFLNPLNLRIPPLARGEPPSSEWRSQIQTIRVPVKPANRERLRRMRAQEMSRWDQHQPPVNPTAPATRAQSSTPQPGADTEARLILLVLAITLSAALLRETPLGSGLSTAGQQLWDLVQSWLG